MAIIIYTYSNPYKINKEPYWAMIKNSFHLCVSQTLVNGLCDQYPEFYKGKLTTITRFINNLYNDWESDITEINQRAIIDNLIEYINFDQVIDEQLNIEDIKLSLKRNRSYVLESIRIMFELGMNPSNIREYELTYEQKCIVVIYKELLVSHNKYFVLREDIKEDEIDNAITQTIEDALQDDSKKKLINNINKDIVVIHGIHQFSPIMLKTIEALGKYKNVIILFNYLQEYKNVYQTWLNVYSWFESKVMISTENFFKNSHDHFGGHIADNIAAMTAGSTVSIDDSEQIRIIEFDSQTEFAGYIAKKFEQAEQEREKDNYSHPALYYMDEQIYSANSSVNQILKIYFPEQFGERNFLDYPIGHFFISVTNMWDEETKGMFIKDMQDIRECLSCGIIEEDNAGDLVTVFDKCKLFFINETTIKGIINRLKKLISRIDDLNSDESETEELLRLEYYDVSSEEIEQLMVALKELNSIVENFFIDFRDQKNNFKVFYKKVIDVLVSKVFEKDELDADFRNIVQRVLQRLNEVKDIDASASFDCLRETMQLYLQQTPKEGKGANWIVRNFEQIDGDVLRKNSKNYNKTYHFACLSDQDMSISHGDEFPWPLDIGFFEVAQAPVDWKYQVYVTSRLEYKNFRRYALVYGLAFSRCNIVLSYIKKGSDKENELYYLFKILNAKILPYMLDEPNEYKKNDRYIDIDHSVYKPFSQYDLMRYRLCRYRFLLETVIESKTVYKDEFLMRQYMAILLEHRTRKTFSGKKYSRSIIRNYLLEQMDELISDFPFVVQLDVIDTIKLAENYIEKFALIYGKFASIKSNETDFMLKRELFLSVPSSGHEDEAFKAIFKNATQTEVDNILSERNLDKDRYFKTRNVLCEKCAEKDICLEIFRTAKK